MKTPELTLHTQLMQMISGYWIAQSISAVAKLGIADLLKENPKSCDELATITNSNSSALYRLMRGLAGVGIFSENAEQQFSLTPLAEYLCTDHPQSLKATSIMLGESPHYQPWGKLLYSIKTGKPAFDDYFDMPVFEYFKSHPEDAEIFEQAMNSFSYSEEAAIMTSYDFSPFKILVDVGGGYGEMLGTLLQKYPDNKGILFDEKYVIDHCDSTLEKHGITNRCQKVSGSFFAEIPTGGDAYLLKHIIHDWDDQRSIKILKNCRKVLPDHGKILVMEMVVPHGNKPSAAKMLDLNMLVMCPGGKERTEEEFKTLFAQSGLKLTKIVRTSEDICIIEGVKI